MEDISSPKNSSHKNNSSKSKSISKKKNKRAPKKGTGKGKALKICLLLCLFVLLIAAGGTLYIIYPYIQETPEFSPQEFQPALTSKLYDSEGKEITKVHGEEDRVEISINQLPEHVLQAFLAIEDRRFYEHIGADPYSIGRAFWVNLQERDWREQGASTITQQLARNAFLSSEQTLKRKVQEVWLALQIERYYSKEEIFEKYLNYVYFGEGAYGIEAAAQTYFEKEAADLTPAEAALLAGLIRSPSHYSPFDNPELAEQRQEVVLRSMNDAGYISEEELEEEKSSETNLSKDRRMQDYPFAYYLDYVIHYELLEILVQDAQYESREEAYQAIYNDGLQIHTAINTGLQNDVEEVLEKEELYPQTQRVDLEALEELDSNHLDTYPQEVLSEEGVAQPQSAAVVADPGSGAIRAMVGGREYREDNKYLRYLSVRQPGSAIKPIFAYVPAMEEEGFSPAEVVDDAPFTQGTWAPENFDRRFRGLTTVREALVHSLNIPAVKVFDQVGTDTGLDYGEKMGLTTIEEQDSLASVLGGMTHGVTPLEMSQAFSVLANKGLKQELYAVEKIKDRNGEVIYSQNTEPEPLLEQETAHLINDILKDVATRGTGANIQSSGEVAAKTGTTSDNRDAWLVTYSPDFVVSFWIGHDIERLGVIPGGSGDTIPFMNSLLSHVESYKPPSDFESPGNIEGPVSVCSKSGLRPGEDCPSEDIVQEYFPPGEAPLERCDLHVELEVCSVSEQLVNEYCPEDEIEKKTFLERPDYEPTDERWTHGAGREPEDADLLPPEEKCEEHEEPAPEDIVELAFSLHHEPTVLEIRWEVLENLHEDEILEGYTLSRQKEGEEEFSTLAELSHVENSYLDEDAERGKTYTYRLEIKGDEEIITELENSVSLPDEENGEHEEDEEQEQGEGEGEGEKEESEDNGEIASEEDEVDDNNNDNEENINENNNENEEHGNEHNEE